MNEEDTDINKDLESMRRFLDENLSCFVLVGYTMNENERIYISSLHTDMERDSIAELLRMATLEAQSGELQIYGSDPANDSDKPLGGEPEDGSQLN